MSNVPQLLKGFRDFLPAEKRARDFITQKIIGAVESFGFEPIQTPTLEYSSLLLGRYGQEADKLVYTFADRGNRQVGLRYDQTVPTARVLAQYQNELPRVFRRYQIQNVFRADKPQKGRYREFTQCDFDIYGTSSPIADAEVIACIYQIFARIGFPNVTFNINDRKSLIELLTPFATAKIGVMSLIQSLDKLDKMPPEAVVAELTEKGLQHSAAVQMMDAVKQTLIPLDIANLMELTSNLGVPTENIKFVPTLARGLDYYTGIIFEMTLPGFSFGSFGGGGRYDNLIKQLGGPSMPAIGVGLGFDRIVEAAMESKLIPDTILNPTQILVTVFDKQTVQTSAQWANKVRESGFLAELFPDTAKLDKQFKYANHKNIPLVVVIGPEELAKQTVVIKDMRTGTQKAVNAEVAISAITDLLTLDPQT
jgi:histidyl-tRNA synthetase